MFILRNGLKRDISEHALKKSEILYSCWFENLRFYTLPGGKLGEDKDTQV